MAAYLLGAAMLPHEIQGLLSPGIRSPTQRMGDSPERPSVRNDYCHSL